MFQPEKNGRIKLVISVIDSGIGISGENQRNLFKLFGSSYSLKDENNGGIGLGLVICDRLVQAFDGIIGLRS